MMQPDFQNMLYLVQAKGKKEVSPKVFEDGHFIGFGPRYYDTAILDWVEGTPPKDRHQIVVESEDAVLAALEYHGISSPKPSIEQRLEALEQELAAAKRA